VALARRSSSEELEKNTNILSIFNITHIVKLF